MAEGRGCDYERANDDNPLRHKETSGSLLTPRCHKMGPHNRLNENPTSLTPVLAIVAPVRDEARYLVEWLAYHRALGINTFLLADNGGNDTTSALLEELDRHRLVKRFDWRHQTKFQLEFYCQAINVARSFADGLFFVDVDEFLRPEGQMSISDVAKTWLADPTVGAVALNSAIYGSSGRQQCDSGLVIERFTRRAHQEFSGNKHAKTFVRVGCCAGPAENPHAVTLDSGRYVDTRGGTSRGTRRKVLPWASQRRSSGTCSAWITSY
jgi:hypothetical protein